MSRRWLFWLVVLTGAALIIGGLVWHYHKPYYHSSQPSSTNITQPTSPPTNSSGNHPLSSVPAGSRQRAKAAGYYCPSWDARPGQVSPSICYPIYDNTHP